MSRTARHAAPTWFVVLVVLTSAASTGSVSASGFSESERSSEPTRDDDLDRRVAVMVDEGLAFLAGQQNDDRSFSAVRGEDVIQAPLAVTALSALAFMANGSTLGRGAYQQQVRTAIEYLLDHQIDLELDGAPPGPLGKDGVPLVPGYFKVESDSTSRTHGHGYATLAIAEAYGTLAPDPRLGDAAESKMRQDQARMKVALQRAVLLIESSQSDKGGWFYQPGDNLDEGSVTITMIQALRAARDVGIDVNKTVIDAAVEYVRKSQRPGDGGFKYQITGVESVTYALTAAAISTLNASGDYDSTVIDLGLEFMKRNDPVFEPHAHYLEDQKFPWYARLYAAQAYYAHRDRKLWERWFPLLVEDLEGRRNDKGSFNDDQYGQVYATATACLMLQIDYQYLPIFQR
ncbi:MAG: terpene cyclase/mutase family protein [Planctomycetes bacterium]|nr:terpene cyclase/mutase family protein [Planctomycetota bacterium]